MRSGKIIIGFLTVLLAAAALLALAAEPSETAAEPVVLEVLVQTEQGTERLQCWESPEGGYYAFLPACADLENMTICPPGGDILLSADDTALTLSGSAGALQFNESYPLRWQTPEGSVETTLTLVSAGDIPSLHIDVASGSMDYIHMSKGNSEPGRLRLYDEAGALLHSSSLTTIKGRGNSSWGAEKKPYNLVLSQPEALLGMDAADRWILLAEGYYSSVNIRNRIVYEFAEAAGLSYSPQCRWVSLYLNGEYAGLYLLSERNEVLEGRVDIFGDGYFLMSLEDESRLTSAGYPHVRTERKQALRIHAADASVQELTDLWQSVENALLSQDGIDPVTGKHWQEFIDLDSWARKYLLEELFGNSDGGSFSQFFYRSGKTEDGKIYAGPVWDYDLAMGGHDSWLGSYTNYFVMNRSEKEEGVSVPWGQALYQKSEFYTRLRELYQEEFLPLMQKLIESDYDEYVQQSLTAQLANGIRWGIEEDDITWELKSIRSFLKKRTAFLSSVWIEEEPYYIVRVDIGRGEVYGHFAVRPGEQVPSLPDSDSAEYLGWFHVDTGEPFDPEQPVWEDMQIYRAFGEFQIPRIHYIPAAVLVLAVLLMMLLEAIRTKKNRSVKHDQGQRSKISP